MIDRDYCGVYSLTCDICGSEADETFFEFYDALNIRSRMDGGVRNTGVNGKMLPRVSGDRCK